MMMVVYSKTRKVNFFKLIQSPKSSCDSVDFLSSKTVQLLFFNHYTYTPQATVPQQPHKQWHNLFFLYGYLTNLSLLLLTTLVLMTQWHNEYKLSIMTKEKL